MRSLVFGVDSFLKVQINHVCLVVLHLLVSLVRVVSPHVNHLLGRVLLVGPSTASLDLALLVHNLRVGPGLHLIMIAPQRRLITTGRRLPIPRHIRRLLTLLKPLLKTLPNNKHAGDIEKHNADNPPESHANDGPLTDVADIAAIGYGLDEQAVVVDRHFNLNFMGWAYYVISWLGLGYIGLFIGLVMDILHHVQEFIHSKEFWLWHGFVLSGLWVLGSALGIFVKRFSTQLHLLIFVIIDFTTLFFAGSALYRVSAGFSNFMDWPLLKKGHVTGGSLFLILVIVQHLGGMTAYFGRKANPQHRSFGKLLVNIGRAVAAVGWLLAGNVPNAIIVAVVSIVLLGLTMMLSPAKPIVEPEAEGRRSKSPRAKRQ